ncbi:hypothetical protein RUM4293_03470 [Ruegeria atlantica]|uniref:Uncharacterized protein n=1 Tax=Ruegeria atlantica TaxID=81569 RepID=A0A0N7LP91_9RHOB|nr:hypothetical protein RUM4293_03470 [Ruegeria atlantica]
MPITECGPNRFARVNGLKKIFGLDDDLVLITCSMTGALTERLIVGVRRTRQDLSEAPFFLWSFAPIEPQGVLIFLIKPDCAFGACNFIGIAHLSTCRDAADIDIAHRATGKPAHDLRVVIIGDGAAWALSMNRFDFGHNLDNRTDQGQSTVDHMWGKISDRAVGHSGRPPCGRGVRVGIEVLSMLAAKPGYVPQFTVGYQLTGKLCCGRSDVVEPDHIGDARGLGRGNHCAPIIQRRSEGFFAQHRLAQG